jgi:CO/xanthine dehydrogenase Mo-binding subunit
MKTMAEGIDQELAFELSQQEVPSAAPWFEVNRRDFLRLFGGGLVVCLCVRSAATQESGRGNFGGHELPKEIAAWLHINEDGRVTAYTGKVEMGQNIRTSLAQQVAEELRVPVDSIAMIMGDTDLTPWDAGTFGSRTTPTMGPQLKTMAVAAREQLVNMAAQRWNTQASTLVAEDGKVTNPQTHQSLTYGEITHGQKLVQLVEDPPFTPATAWKVAGKPVPKVEGRDFVTGKHKYTSDLIRPGMLYGKVLRPTGFKATLTSFNDDAAKKIPGVRVVHDGDFIGVAAPDAWSAERAIEVINSEWKVPQQPSNQQLVEYLKKNVNEGERGSRHATGSVEEALASADSKLSATYTVQYIAHAPLEPRAAVAEWNGDKLTMWTGTQRPFAVRDELASAFHIPPEKVRVTVPDTGSAYGGKHTGECAIEAARLAKAAGKPVKLVWTREEEFTWAYFRPGGVIETRSGVKNDGTVVAWEFHNYNSGPSGIGTPYNIPNQLIQFHPVDSPLRQGSYRGLAATANHFARESQMDELASAVKMDPLEFRLKNLSDVRLRAVLQAAAEKFGWGKLKPAAGRGFGLACGFEKGGYFGTCAEVEVDRASRNVQIRRVVEAFECGAVVNPDGLRNQVEGSIVQAIGGALFEAIRFDNGRVLNPHFAEYRVPRFRDTPQIDVVLIDRKDLPSTGAGETPIMGLAPAVGNAIFAATGTRVRSLPMVPEGIPATQS